MLADFPSQSFSGSVSGSESDSPTQPVKKMCLKLLINACRQDKGSMSSELKAIKEVVGRWAVAHLVRHAQYVACVGLHRKFLEAMKIASLIAE